MVNIYPYTLYRTFFSDTKCNISRYSSVLGDAQFVPGGPISIVTNTSVRSSFHNNIFKSNISDHNNV